MVLIKFEKTRVDDLSQSRQRNFVVQYWQFHDIRIRRLVFAILNLQLSEIYS